MTQRYCCVSFLFVFLTIITKVCFAEQVNVAVASNFLKPMKVIVKAFEEETGHKVVVSSGSSGRFYAQIKHGAPYDLFFSADQEKAIKLEEENLVIKGSRVTYAQGTLVLWSAEPNYVQEGKRIQSGDFNRLALANPKLAPYGLAATEVINRLQANHSVKGKLVKGENIAQTFQFVSSGNADLGFVARSQLSDKPQGSYWSVPAELHQPIKQDVVVLKRAKDNTAAISFLGFVMSEPAQKVMIDFGYR